VKRPQDSEVTSTAELAKGKKKQRTSADSADEDNADAGAAAAGAGIARANSDGNDAGGAAAAGAGIASANSDDNDAGGAAAAGAGIASANSDGNDVGGAAAAGAGIANSDDNDAKMNESDMTEELEKLRQLVRRAEIQNVEHAALELLKHGFTSALLEGYDTYEVLRDDLMLDPPKGPGFRVADARRVWHAVGMVLAPEYLAPI
jgi:hypothetical protein